MNYQVSTAFIFYFRPFQKGKNMKFHDFQVKKKSHVAYLQNIRAWYQMKAPFMYYNCTKSHQFYSNPSCPTNPINKAKQHQCVKSIYSTQYKTPYKKRSATQCNVSVARPLVKITVNFHLKASKLIPSNDRYITYY